MVSFVPVIASVVVAAPLLLGAQSPGTVHPAPTPVGIVQAHRAADANVFFSATTSCGGIAITCVPFNYIIDFKVKLDGREMDTTSVTFCNNFTSTSAPGTTKIYIQLQAVGASDTFVKVSFPTDGHTWQYCWNGVNNAKNYFFQYAKANDGKEVQGHGTATGSA